MKYVITNASGEFLSSVFHSIKWTPNEIDAYRYDVQQIAMDIAGKVGGTVSLSENASWVIIDKSTGRAVRETFSDAFARSVNREKYDVLGIMQHLRSLNGGVKS